jgi:hypothetical protein
MIYKTNDELQTACTEWQKRLRLQDWIVKPKLYRERDMKLSGCQGECEWQLKTKIAAIRILDVVDYPEDLIIDQDMEKVLVHELLHLHFAALYADTKDASINDAQEQAIDCIAYSLVDLYREKIPQAKKELKVV